MIVRGRFWLLLHISHRSDIVSSSSRELTRGKRMNNDAWNRITDFGPKIPTTSELENDVDELSERVTQLESSLASLAFRREG